MKRSTDADPVAETVMLGNSGKTLITVPRVVTVITLPSELDDDEYDVNR